METEGYEKKSRVVSRSMKGICVHICECITLCVAGGRQSGAILYNAFGVMGRSDTGGKTGMSKSNGSTGSQTGSGYSTDVSDDNLPHDAISPASDVNEHSDSDDQVTC